MSIPPAWQQCLDFFDTLLVIKRSPGRLSGDAGLLPVRQSGQGVGLTRAFAEARDGPCDPGPQGPRPPVMVRARLSGALSGYRDRDCHDTRLSS
jgi:hypothetical protein